MEPMSGAPGEVVEEFPIEILEIERTFYNAALPKDVSEVSCMISPLTADEACSASLSDLAASFSNEPRLSKCPGIVEAIWIASKGSSASMASLAASRMFTS